MARIKRRVRALADIGKIWSYIADDSVGNADRWLERLDEKLELWSIQPDIGRARDELGIGIRSMPYGKYLVFYVPLADGIDVLRILHASRDIDSNYF